MTIVATTPAQSRSLAEIFRKMEIDMRLLGMLAALAFIWIGFDILSGGAFLTARNIWNLSVQASSISIMATGMVLIIVSRNIDLSVGAILGFTGMVIGVMQVRWLPGLIGFENPFTWVICVVAAIVTGTAIGLLQGAIIAYLGVSSFIVTLGGLLFWRGAAWWVATGQTVAPVDSHFKLIGGGIEGSIGAMASWGVGIAAVLASLLAIVSIRRRRKRFGFALRPVWAELAVALLICGAIVGCVMVMNSYYLPTPVARRIYEAKGLAWPEGGVDISYGFAIPVLIAIAIGVILTFMAQRTRFGRYIFATGNNPEAAELSGINTKKLLMWVFGLMGGLAGISACVSVARLNAATNSAGTLDELYVIAAAVIGGSSLTGGVGTIYGAMLGAVVMQSLQSGMVLLGLDAPLQNMVVGVVLVFAVWADGVYRRHVV